MGTDVLSHIMLWYADSYINQIQVLLEIELEGFFTLKWAVVKYDVKISLIDGQTMYQ